MPALSAIPELPEGCTYVDALLMHICKVASIDEIPADIREKMNDPRWRICNLYKIKPKTGAPIIFTPRPEQWEIIDHLIDHPDNMLVIIKSRQIGGSTAIGVCMVDFSMFNLGVNCNLIDQTKADAHKKSEGIILLAIQSLKETAPWLWNAIEWHGKVGGIKTERKWRFKGEGDFQWRTIYAGENARGGTSQWLWCSEGGPIAARADQQQWDRISLGAIPAAEHGRQVHETTWQGGKAGGMWGLIKPIYESGPMKNGRISSVHGTLLFFPWHSDPTCVSHVEGVNTSQFDEYFAKIESECGKTLTQQQRTFYALKVAEKLKDPQQARVKQEYPSTLEEALETPGANPRFEEAGLDWIHQRQTTDAPPCKYFQLVAQGDEYPTLVPSDERNGWLRIWRMPLVGRRYGLPCDFSTDKPEKLTDDFDHHACSVLGAPAAIPGTTEVLPLETVASIMPDQRTDLDILAKRIALMSRFYGDCIVIPEINKHEGYPHALRQAGCVNIYRRPRDMDNRHKNTAVVWEVGWQTTASTKPVIVESLASFIRDKAIITYCPAMLAELRVFQENNAALPGHHDDWVVSLAIGCHTVHSFTAFVKKAPPMALPEGHGMEGGSAYGYSQYSGEQSIGG